MSSGQLVYQAPVPRPSRRRNTVPAAIVEQLMLDFDGAPLCAPDAERPASEPDGDLAAFAASERLSGPRRVGNGHMTALDDPRHALPGRRCRCERPMPLADAETRCARCLKCGRSR